MKTLKLFPFIVSIMFVSCAHHNNVRPGEDGVHRVILHTDDPQRVGPTAIKQANHFCKQAKKIAVIIKEASTYHGDMDEKSYKNSKKIAGVISDVGTSVWILGGNSNTSRAGRAATIGGHSMDNALGNNYTFEMQFKCQNI